MVGRCDGGGANGLQEITLKGGFGLNDRRTQTEA